MEKIILVIKEFDNMNTGIKVMIQYGLTRLPFGDPLGADYLGEIRKC